VISPSSLLGFVLVVGVLTVTPGLDTALIVRTAAGGHARRAWGVVLGIQNGTLLWGLLTSLGLAAVLVASATVYEILRWAGVAYLAWIGLGLLRQAVRRGTAAETETSGSPGHEFLRGWRRGVTTNLLNPKMGAFYVALLPQFIPSGANPVVAGIVLASVHVLLGLLWSAVLVHLAGRFRRILARSGTRRVLDAVSGTVILGFGARLALTVR